jgi:hypothetical protein
MSEAPQKEPKSTTPEKPPIRKTHEEFTGQAAQPSRNRKEYEEEKAGEKARSPSELPPQS